MKSTALFILICLIFPLTITAQIDRSVLPEPGEPRPIEIGEYETFTLKNGLQVFVVENHKLPRVTYRLQLDLKPIEENDRAGYLSMVGDLMTRGTTTRSKQELDEEVDFIGASLSAGSQFAYASGLSKYDEKILGLMADVILNPTFPASELEKIKKQTLSGLQANKEDPAVISSRLNAKIVYGEDHPYGELETEETVEHITSEDIQSYHEIYFRPNVAYLAVVGDVQPRKVKKLIKKYFEEWAPGEIPEVSYDQPESPTENKVALVNRGNAVQSVIDVVYPVELHPASEDVIPARVMNQILGGGFSSRLNMNLREEKAYTYGIGSSLSSDEIVGSFSAGASVRNEVTDSAIVQVLQEMEGMLTEDITDEEMTLAKNSIAGSFARSLESPQTVASFAINTAIYNLPDDYYATYIQKVQAVTRDDIKEMAQKYVHPSAANITVVGKLSEIESGLKQFGPIAYYDASIKPVDPATLKIPAGLTAEQVFEDYFDALGGKEKLESVESLEMNMSAEVNGNELNFTIQNKVPQKVRVDVEMGGMAISQQVFDGQNASITQMGQPVPVDEEMKAEMAMQAYPFPELYFEENNVSTKLTGVESVNGSDAYVVEVSPGEDTYSLYFDTTSGLLVRKSETGEMPNGEMMVQNTDFSDYQETEGILFPGMIKIPLGPGLQADAKLESIKVNPEIADEIFSVSTE